MGQPQCPFHALTQLEGVLPHTASPFYGWSHCCQGKLLGPRGALLRVRKCSQLPDAALTVWGLPPPSLLLSAQLSRAMGILLAGVSPAAPLCCCFQAHGPHCLVEECPGEGPDVVRGCPVFQPPDHPVPAWERGHQVSRGPLQGERAHLGMGNPRARGKPGLVWALGEVVVNPCSHRPRAGQGCVPGGPGLLVWEPPAEWKLAAMSRKPWSEARAWGENGGSCVCLSNQEPQPGGVALPGLGTQAPQWTGSTAPWRRL